LSRNVHENIHLQSSVDKYGIDVFEFNILFKCPKEYCIKLEQWCLDSLKPEYNMCKVAGNRAGHKQSIETINRRMQQQDVLIQDQLQYQMLQTEKIKLSKALYGNLKITRKINSE